MSFTGELAFMINASFPGVRYVGLDVDKEYCFPKGAARATFFTRETYLSALRARFLSILYLDHRGIVSSFGGSRLHVYRLRFRIVPNMLLLCGSKNDAPILIYPGKKEDTGNETVRCGRRSLR